MNTIVTGGTAGIGAAIAEQLAGHGAHRSGPTVIAGRRNQLTAFMSRRMPARLMIGLALRMAR